MLREYPTKQIVGESRRRWFGDEEWDVIVWQDPDGQVVGFQLCYDRTRDEHALTWQKNGGFTHQEVDAGEGDVQRHKQSPILVADGPFDAKALAHTFAQKNGAIDPYLARFIRDRLAEMILQDNR